MPPMLFTPMQIRDLTLRNRVVVSPMCQYSAVEGMLNDWHLAHLSQFSMGGCGLVIVEATAVEKRGRITYGDSGLWSDDQIAAHAKVVQTARALGGAAIGLQLAHAGRKASIQRPWEGDAALTEIEFAKGEVPWDIVAPSPVPFADGWLVPHELAVAEIAEVIDAWVAATRRAEAAGYDMIEIHSAHGYLTHSFLSPIANRRSDGYGGSRENRMRFALELTEAVRAAWPQGKPLFYRISSADGKEGGWQVEDTVALARRLKALGVDVIDCSSGGVAGYGRNTMARPTPGYQVGFAAQVRREAEIATQAVGMIVDAAQAETVLRAGAADLVALARELLYNPYWAHHAAQKLGADPDFLNWQPPYGHWLGNRAKGNFGKRIGDVDREAASPKQAAE